MDMVEKFEEAPAREKKVHNNLCLSPQATEELQQLKRVNIEKIRHEIEQTIHRCYRMLKAVSR